MAADVPPGDSAASQAAAPAADRAADHGDASRQGRPAQAFSQRRTPAATLPEADPDDGPMPGGPDAFERVNATQVRYAPMSRINPTGAVVPATMAAATRSALEALDGRVGDVDAWVCGRQGWVLDDLGACLTSEQVDGVALALDAADRREGIIVADQTGFGKGRLLAAVARAAVRSGRPVIFLTEKENLFSDFWRDVRDIAGADAFGRPFMLNDGARIVDTSSEDGRVLVPAWKKADVERAVRAGEIPAGSRLVMATYSQFNRKGTRKTAFLESIARGAHVILDESHNFVGDSTTSKTVGAALAAAWGSTFSSATFARDVTNLAAYSTVFPWLSRIQGLDEMTPAQRRAIAEESVRLATGAGRIIRREHDLTNMVLRMHTADGARLARNRELADLLAPILSKMARLARRVDAVLAERNEANRLHLDTLVSAEERKAAREVFLTANFGSRLSAVLGQFLLALNVDPCVEQVVASLLRGEKPVVVIQTTMEAMMRELVRDDLHAAGEPEGAETGAGDTPQAAFDFGGEGGEAGNANADAADAPGGSPPSFRDALGLLADRLLKVSRRFGAAYEKEQVVLDEPGMREAQEAILDLVREFPDLNLSPIDDIRDRVEAEGRRLAASGRIARPWQTDEISARGMRVVDGRYTAMPQADRNQIVARFVNGTTQMLVLTQAASTGLSLHDSDKFADSGTRHMFEVDPSRNVLARIQMWGRIWRRGQISEPRFTVLDTGLPFHSYDLAVRNRKLCELSASVTGTERATVSLDLPDPVDQIGNEVAHELLQEQQQLTEAMAISLNVDQEEADRELYFVGKLFRRMPLLLSATQDKVCRAFYSAYEDRLRSGGDAHIGRDLDGEWEAVRREVLEPGDGTGDPLTGLDVTVTTIRTIREAMPLASHAVVAAVREAAARLDGGAPFAAHRARIVELRPLVLDAALPRKRYKTVRQALAAGEDNPVRRAAARLDAMDDLLGRLLPGNAVRMPGEDGEVVDAVVLDVRAPPVARANVGREYEITYAVPGGERPRTVSLDAMVRDSRARPLHDQCAAAALIAAFDAAPRGTVAVERKVLDGNGIGAVLAARRMGCGTRVTYSDTAGRTRIGVLMPRGMERRIAIQPCRTSQPTVAAEVLARGGRLRTDPLHPADGVEIRPDQRRGGVRVVIPAGKRAAKGFETPEMLALTGPFQGDWREREAHVKAARVSDVLAVLARAGCQFFFDAAHRAAAVESARAARTACCPEQADGPRPG